jgi:hypothetical protein
MRQVCTEPRLIRRVEKYHVEERKMKIHKTISEKVINANRENAKKSTGPKGIAGKLAVRNNAVKHGLLATKLICRTEEERTEFHALLDELEEDYKPAGALERMLVEEIGVCWWKLREALGWELQEFQNQRKVSKMMYDAFIAQCNDVHLPLQDSQNDSGAAVPSGWDCREVVLKRSSREYEKDTSFSDETAVKAGRVELEAKLNSSVNTILRYETTLKRDLYRAINALERVQEHERERAKNKQTIPKKGVASEGGPGQNKFAKQSH